MTNDTPRPGQENRPKEFLNVVVQQMTDFSRELAVREIPQERAWFRNMLIGILNLTHNNFLAVDMGAGRMPLFAAWGARNLLELRVITTYVLQSEENASAFKDDLVVDMKEFWDAVRKLEEHSHKRLIATLRETSSNESDPTSSFFSRRADELEKAGPNVYAAKQELEKSIRLMEAFGVDPERKPKHGSAIAKIVPENEMFDPRFKMLSKLVHPTALSIAATTERDSLVALSSLTWTMASSDLVEIFSRIRRHVEAYGLSWPS